MGFKPYTIDDSIEYTGGGRRPHVKDGYYLLQVTGIQPSPEDLPDDKETYWKWNTRIVEGAEAVGRSWPEHCIWKADTQFSNARMFAAVAPTSVQQLKHVTIDTYAKHVGLAAKVATGVTGRKFGVLIGEGKPYQGNPTSEIQEIMTEAEYRERVAILQAAISNVQALPQGGTPAYNGPAAQPQATPGSLDSVVDNLFPPVTATTL